MRPPLKSPHSELLPCPRCNGGGKLQSGHRSGIEWGREGEQQPVFADCPACDGTGFFDSPTNRMLEGAREKIRTKSNKLLAREKIRAITAPPTEQTK